MALDNPDLDILNSKNDSKDTQDSSNSKEDDNEDDNLEIDNEELNKMLMDLVEEAEKEDIELRWSLLAKYKRNDYYFNNIQKLFYDETAKDFKDINSIVDSLKDITGVDDIKTINIYRAYAESIISALSVQPPSVEFTPDDAQNPDDVQTAEAYSRISELVSRHNSAPLLLIKALTIHFNCGVIFGHNYYKNDPSYGITRTPKGTTSKEVKYADIYCGDCGVLLDAGLPENVIAEGSKFHCKACGYDGTPNIVIRLENIDEVTEWESTPKGRSCFDIFGPTYVKVSLSARNQAGIGYLILRLEDSIYKYREIYKDSDELEDGPMSLIAESGDTTKYERWARIPPEYTGIMPKNLTTARHCWIRPWYYNNLEDEEKIEYLQSKYPEGVLVSVINDKVVEKRSAKLDDEWTISFDPKANFIHAEAPGNSVIPIQDAKNDTFNLGLQSIEYGIPETFAHPKTLNIKKYSQNPHAVGMISSAMPPGPDKNLSDGFTQLKTATLSSEYTNFDASLDKTGQFISGAMPGIWGGMTTTGNPATATETSDNKAMQLQRLQLTYQMVSVFWGKLIYKCSTDFAKNMREDEKYSSKKNGTFVNVWIYKSELQGKIGELEPEVSGEIPQSWVQKHGMFMRLVNMMPDSPQLAEILLHPNNIENLKQIVGLPDFYLPGENDRNKQWGEYYVMSTPMDSENGQTQYQPIDIDIEVDDHVVHMQVLKNILVSPIGVQLYKTAPEAYQNCIIHYKNHEMAQQAKSIAPSGNTEKNKPAESSASTSQG